MNFRASLPCADFMDADNKRALLSISLEPSSSWRWKCCWVSLTGFPLSSQSDLATPAQPSELLAETTSLGTLLWQHLFLPLSLPSASVAFTALIHSAPHIIVTHLDTIRNGGVVQPGIQKQESWGKMTSAQCRLWPCNLAIWGQVTRNHS